MFSFDPEATALIRKLRKNFIYPEGAAGVSVAYGVSDVERIIPHRPPMRFVDGLSAIDLEGRRIRGTRTLDPSDPIFGGHFPGQPVYPGALQVETMGQAALCLAAFLAQGTAELGGGGAPLAVRALRVIHAQYLEPLLPGDVLELHASILEEDGMTATAAGQLTRHGRVVSLAVQEVYFVE